MSTTKPHQPPGPKHAPAHSAPTPAPAAAPQAPAYVPLKSSDPFAMGDNKDGADAHSFFEALSHAGDGFYPLGANGIWHGGMHFDAATEKVLKQEDGVRAVADGEVVAYRLDSKYAVSNFSLPDSLRVDSPDTVWLPPGTISEPTDLSATSLDQLDPCAPVLDPNSASPFRFDKQPSADKPKAKQPLAKGAQVYSKAKGEAIGLLPQEAKCILAQSPKGTRDGRLSRR